jgi:myo-inositol-1(or 4)-monophosphatase
VGLAWTEGERARLRRIARGLALAIRTAVLPRLGGHSGRAHGDEAGAGGDISFDIDMTAERALAGFMARAGGELAFYSEHRGLVLPDSVDSRSVGASGAGRARARTASAAAPAVLVVDPIDGTRPALAGLESCCVSVAAAPLRDRVTMAEVEVGCVVEIPTGVVFLAERGRGLLEGPPARLSRAASLERMFWTYGFRGRPARATVELLAELIDRSSVGGGTFELGSAAYDMTRVLTGQLDAYVEPGPRLVEEVAGLRREFERVGDGAVLNNSPYDLAAAWLCLTESGATVTDAAGRPLDDRPLLGSGPAFQMSVVASGAPELHARLLAALDRGMERVRVLEAEGRLRAAVD